MACLSQCSKLVDLTLSPVKTAPILPPNHTVHMSFFQHEKPEGPHATSDGHPLLRTQTPSKSSIASSYVSTNTTTLPTAKKAATPDSHEFKYEQADGTQLPFVRPKTPLQGSKHVAWSSYRDLPQDHPVFRYPNDMREKMYSKGIGKPYHFSRSSYQAVSFCSRREQV